MKCVRKGQTDLKNHSASLRRTTSSPVLFQTSKELNFQFYSLTFTRGKRYISNEAKGHDDLGVYFYITLRNKPRKVVFEFKIKSELSIFHIGQRFLKQFNNFQRVHVSLVSLMLCLNKRPTHFHHSMLCIIFSWYVNTRVCVCLLQLFYFLNNNGCCRYQQPDIC